MPFLTDSNEEIQATAACNLGEINDSRSIAYLIDLAQNDADEKVRAEALAALDNFRSIEILMCLINEVRRSKQSRRPRQIVAQQLQYYDDERSVDTLIFLLLKDKDVCVRIFSANALNVLNRSSTERHKFNHHLRLLISFSPLLAPPSPLFQNSTVIYAAEY